MIYHKMVFQCLKLPTQFNYYQYRLMGTCVTEKKKPLQLPLPEPLSEKETKLKMLRLKRFTGPIDEDISKIQIRNQQRIQSQFTEQQFQSNLLPVEDITGELIYIAFTNKNAPISQLIDIYLKTTQYKFIDEDQRSKTCFKNIETNQLYQKVNEKPLKIKDIEPFFRQQIMKVVIEGSGKQYNPEPKKDLIYDPNSYVPQGKPIAIRVKYKNQQLKIKCFSKDPIGKIKFELQQKLHIESLRQSIYLEKDYQKQHRNLEQGNSLADYSVMDNDCLILNIQQAPRTDFKKVKVIQISVKDYFGNQHKIPIELSNVQRIYNIKQAISQALSIDLKLNVSKFKLLIKGRPLDDDRPVTHYYIKSGTKLHITPININANGNKDLYLLKVHFNAKHWLQFTYGCLKNDTIKSFIEQNISQESSYELKFEKQILNPACRFNYIESQIPSDTNQINVYLFRIQKYYFWRNFRRQVRFEQQFYQFSNFSSQKADWQRSYISKIDQDQRYDEYTKSQLKDPKYYFPIFEYTLDNAQINNFLIKLRTKKDFQILQNSRAFTKASSLIQSVKQQQNYVGIVYRAVRNYKFSRWHSKGNLVCFRNFTSTSKDQITARNFLHEQVIKKSQNKTVFKIRSRTGRNIQEFSIFQEKEVVFLPFTYFYIQNIVKDQQQANTDFVFLVQTPSPFFQHNTLLWVDDNPQQRTEILQRLTQISENPLEILHIESTRIAAVWMKQFNWLYERLAKKLKIVTTQKRKQILYDSLGNQKQIENQYAGVDLLNVFFSNYSYYNHRILILAQNRQQTIMKIRQRINRLQDRKINVSDTTDIQALHKFCRFRQ